MESSRRDLLSDVTDHRSILKTDQNKYYPSFSFTPKTCIELHKTGVSFLPSTFSKALMKLFFFGHDIRAKDW